MPSRVFIFLQVTHLGGLAVGVNQESVADVDPGVFAELAGPQEALGADAAGVRFLGYMDLLVSSEVGGSGEGLPACGAVVHLVRVVALQVFSESGGSREAPPTDGADVKLRHVAATFDCE